MKRAIGTTTAVLLCIGATSLSCPTGYADPTPAIQPAPGEGVNIPGMKFGVNVGDPCDRSSDSFGRNTDGATLVCVIDADDDKTVTIWVRSAPLAGVRQEGASCYGTESNMVAMSPQGGTMVCAGTYDAKRKKEGRDYVWTLSS